MDTFFRIEYLIPKVIENRLAEYENNADKTKLLLELLDFPNSEKFSGDEKKIISEYYISQTNEPYSPKYLDFDTVTLFVGYSAKEKDFEKIKKSLSGLCNTSMKEIATDNIQKELENIEQEIQKQKEVEQKQEVEKKSKIIFDLEFEEINSVDDLIKAYGNGQTKKDIDTESKPTETIERSRINLNTILSKIKNKFSKRKEVIK